MKTQLQAIQGSVTGKVLFIGALILLLLIPLGMIEGLIRERTFHYEAATASVARSMGAAQTVGGPVLVVPFRFTRWVNAHPVTVSDELYLLPDALEITGTVDTSERMRGIYKVPVYTARLHLTGRFPEARLEGEYEGLELLWNLAQIALPLTDARSVREPIVFAAGNASTTFQAGGERVAGFGPQLVARYAELGLGAPAAPQAFSLDLSLDGTGTLNFLPLGKETRVSVTSNWQHPSFAGAYLPDSPPDVTANGFTAEWNVLDLGRGFPSAWLRSDTRPWVSAAAAFGVRLMQPIGIHEATMRAAKYAVLIVSLTFVAYFLFELFAKLRLHALQYLLIGLANSVFYVLLLALAEHIGFPAAYAASVAAATGLITSYSAAVLRSFRRAVPIGVLLAGLYGYLYVTLLAEDFALLIGAVGSFAMLAALMYLTRKVDWFAVRFGADRVEEDGGARIPLHA